MIGESTRKQRRPKQHICFIDRQEFTGIHLCIGLKNFGDRFLSLPPKTQAVFKRQTAGVIDLNFREAMKAGEFVVCGRHWNGALA